MVPHCGIFLEILGTDYLILSLVEETIELEVRNVRGKWLAHTAHGPIEASFFGGAQDMVMAILHGGKWKKIIGVTVEEILAQEMQRTLLEAVETVGSSTLQLSSLSMEDDLEMSLKEDLMMAAELKRRKEAEAGAHRAAEMMAVRRELEQQLAELDRLEESLETSRQTYAVFTQQELETEARATQAIMADLAARLEMIRADKRQLERELEEVSNFREVPKKRGIFGNPDAIRPAEAAKKDTTPADRTEARSAPKAPIGNISGTSGVEKLERELVSLKRQLEESLEQLDILEYTIEVLQRKGEHLALAASEANEEDAELIRRSVAEIEKALKEAHENRDDQLEMMLQLEALVGDAEAQLAKANSAREEAAQKEATGAGQPEAPKKDDASFAVESALYQQKLAAMDRMRDELLEQLALIEEKLNLLQKDYLELNLQRSELRTKIADNTRKYREIKAITTKDPAERMSYDQKMLALRIEGEELQDSLLELEDVALRSSVERARYQVMIMALQEKLDAASAQYEIVKSELKRGLASASSW